MQIWFAAVLAVASLAAGIQARPPFEDALIGSWSGTLEYRDYRSDRRVTLPTQLVITAEGPGVRQYLYTYDDGPGKTVKSSERITIGADRSSYRIQSGDGTYDATFRATGLAEGAEAVVLSGTGTENETPVELRITVTVTATSLLMVRESRRAGEDWAFRNRYRLSR